MDDMETTRQKIKRFGGCSAVALLCRVHKVTVFRWQSGKHRMPDSASLLLDEIERGGGMDMIAQRHIANPKRTG
jgi:hypothetical protein